MGTGLLTPTHIIFVLVIALVVLGPKRLPEAGRSIGHGLREFKAAITGGDDEEIDSSTSETAARPAVTVPASAPSGGPDEPRPTV